MGSITDIVPEEGRDIIIEGFDDSRTAELDMEHYRKLLGAATRHLAEQRAMGRICLKQDNNESDCPFIFRESRHDQYTFYSIKPVC